MRPFSIVRSAFALVTAVTLLAGCSTNFAPGPETPVQTAFGPVGGQVYGGQAPITGAQIYAYQTSTSAYGGASKSLISATGGVTGFPPTEDGKGNYYVATDASGAFEISSATTCTSGTVVYLYSLGGNAGGGANTNASEMAVLGTCPASGLLINALTAGTSVRIYMNEVSTVAAAYALAGFATDATDIGAPTTTGGVVTDTLAQTGIQNAGANAAQIYTAVATSLTTPGSSRTANATTPNGNGTVPQSTVDTIANILASCINSAKPFTNCNTLFSDDRSEGGTTGTRPTDTATAAIYLAQHPYSSDVTALFNLVSSTGHVFSPDLGTATPTNYTITLNFSGGGIVVTAEQPHGVAIDASGNVWLAGNAGTVLSEYSPLGVPANATGFALGLGEPNSVALDVNSSHVWISDISSNSVTNFDIATQRATTYTDVVDGKSIFDYPSDVQIDASGNAWVVNGSNDTLDKLNSSTGALITASTDGANDMNGPYTIAIEPGATGDIWVVNYGGSSASVFTDAVATVGNYTKGTPSNPLGNAIDSSGNVWFSNYGTNTVSKMSSTGASGSSYKVGTTGTSKMSGIAVDGGDNIWVGDDPGKSVFELDSAGANLSGTAGYAASPATETDGIAIDQSGNVWYTSNGTTAYLYEIVGAAVPTVTPIAYAVAHSLLGARP